MCQRQRNAIAQVPLFAVHVQQALYQEASKRANRQRKRESTHDDDANFLWFGQPIGVNPCHRILRCGHSQTKKLTSRCALFYTRTHKDSVKTAIESSYGSYRKTAENAGFRKGSLGGSLDVAGRARKEDRKTMLRSAKRTNGGRVSSASGQNVATVMLLSLLAGDARRCLGHGADLGQWNRLPHATRRTD